MSLGGVLSVHLKIELLMPIAFFSETLNFVCFFRSVRVIQLTELDFPRPPTVRNVCFSCAMHNTRPGGR